MVILLQWFSWQLVAALIGVTGTIANAWLQNKRAEREAAEIESRLRALEGFCTRRARPLLDELDELLRKPDPDLGGDAGGAPS